MNRILVVFLGGTIGSKENKQIIQVDDSTGQILLQKYRESAVQRDVIIETICPVQMLSENLIPDDWMMLRSRLLAANFSQYDGVVITHGTDTLPYTAAAMSYLFCHSPVPIILTASNRPLTDENSNGLRNFINAVDFILENPLSGVFVLFENSRGDALVYLGTRLSEAVPVTHEFFCVNALPFGKMENGRFVANAHKWNPQLTAFSPQREQLLGSACGFSTKVLLICPHPGLNYRYYHFGKERPQAVLHSLYHSGTACVRENAPDFSLEEYVRYCRGKEVDFYITPFQPDLLYASANRLMEAGAIPLRNISVEAAVVKIMLAYGSFSDKEKVQEFLRESNVFFEDCRSGGDN